MELDFSQEHHTHVSFLDRAGRSFGTRAEHICTRNCRFAQVVGNCYVCQSSGSVHVCDSNCSQRVAIDPHTSVCRLSKRQFSAIRCAPAERTNSSFWEALQPEANRA
ncbi:hypothetical protein WJX81_007253 [Elliptochloris bilobata]|uniref:Uncharacterized protein n=1 Tax=Elliptochloris bilobata TaxID=381761 RepID=A0AAW1RKU5_9CHLO